MGQIQVISEALANQIAAGEVVERPASCVKELVENSIDADARSILVSIEEGGISAIVVQDDGAGMDEGDARLAFARHATSKIKHQRDLFRIGTLGFRGEALASISAVARVGLQTRRHDAEHGIRVTVEGGPEVSPSEPIGMPPGTRIEVRDLFFNTPARLKYLRSVTTEQARCVEVVQKAALSRPDVAVRCEVNGHVLFQTGGRGDTLEVLAAVYGAGEARQFLKVSGQTADYRIHGYIGRPTQSKASRAHGHLFVNGRPIRNLSIHQAILAGYQNRLMVNRHPMYALYIDLDATLVDVNIHPHKAEVRFSEERDLALLIQNSVRTALDEAFLVPNVQVHRSGVERERSVQTELPAFTYRRTESPVSERNTEVRETGRDATERNSDWRQRPAAGGGYDRKRPEAAAQPALSSEQLNEVFGRAPEADLPPEQQTAGSDLPEVASVSTPNHAFRLRPIGQALGMYIVADDGEHLYIIDQHAAHERVLYERFSKRMQERQIHTLPLLTPLTLTLTPEQHVAMTVQQDVLRDMGLSFEEFGGRDMLLRTVPDIWEGLDAAWLAEELVQSLTQVSAKVDVRAVVRDVVVMRACKAAIKANRFMSNMEMDALCEALSDLEDPFHCPHGRPVFIRLSTRELEKEFRRIV